MSGPTSWIVKRPDTDGVAWRPPSPPLKLALRDRSRIQSTGNITAE